MTGRERLLNHLRGDVVDSLPFMPITMMFAADLQGVASGEYATNGKLLAEAQVRVAETFDTDHVNTLTDPAREAADCGADIVYYPDQPPAVRAENALLLDPGRLATLKQPDPLGGGRMHDRVVAVEVLATAVGGEKLVEGWVEGPCAEAADLRGINNLMTDFYDDPGFVRDLFSFNVEMGLAFARPQIEAGAELIGIGDAAASLVSREVYDAFVWPYEKQLIDGIHAMGGMTRLHICGNTTALVGGMAALGCAIVDLDYMVDMVGGRAAAGPEQVLLGNIDPVRVLRDRSPEGVRDAIAACHRAAGPRYVVGAGCEVCRDTDHGNLHALREYARGNRP